MSTVTATPTSCASPTSREGCRVSFMQSPVANTSCRVGQFAIARAKGNICLVQVSSAISSMMPVDVKIFQHEFITIYHHILTCSLSPADLSILEPIDNDNMRYEEESGRVYLAKEIMQRLSRLEDARHRMTMLSRGSSQRRQARR